MNSHQEAEPAGGGISVVVACLENAGSLKVCLEALALQAPLRAGEVILADPWDRPLPPGSLDMPGLRVRLLSRPGASPAAVSNEAVGMTPAGLVAHLASDKKPCANFLSEHAAALEGGADVSVGGCLAPKEGDGAFGRFLLLSNRREPRALQSQAPQPGQFCPANMAFKKETFSAAGGFDEEQAGPFPYWADCSFGERALDKGAVSVYRESAAAQDAALPGLDGWLLSEEAVGREKARLSGIYPELEPEYAAKYEAYSLYGSMESLERAEQDLRTVITKLEGLPAQERAQLKAVRRNPQGIEYSFGALDALYPKVLNFRRARGLYEGLCLRLGPDWAKKYAAELAPFSEAVKPAHAKLPPGSGPLFSVVIPVWNSGRELEKVVENFLAQGAPGREVEVVLGDDGSGPETVALLYELGKKPGVKVVLTAGHKGQAAATNAAAGAASGQYLLLSSSDIEAEPDLLAQHLRSHRAAPDEIMVLGYLPWGRKTGSTRFMRYIVSEGTQFGYGLITDPENVGPEFVYAPNLSLRREMFERVGGFDEQFIFGAQDSDFGVKVRKAGMRIVYNSLAVGWHNHKLALDRFIEYRQPLAGKGQVQYCLKWPVLRPLAAVKREAALKYCVYLETPWLPSAMYDVAMRMEGMLDSDCPVIAVRDRDSGNTEKIPARTFAYDFLLNYHRCAGAYAEITAREGAGWERQALRDAVRAGSPGPEKLAWHASRTLGAVRLFLDGVRRFGPFDSMGTQNFYCLERPCAGRGKEKEREYAGASAA